MDRIKIIATLKWAYDLLREDGHYEALDDVEDCIVMLKMEQQQAISDDFGREYARYNNTPEYKEQLEKMKANDERIKELESIQTEHQFKYTPYGLRSDESGKLSIGEIPHREWVGLTDDEIEDTWGNTPMMLNARDGGARRVFARAIEAKLKEKNG